MSGICKCEATECECNRCQLCKRQKYDGEIMNFKSICNDKIGYIWFAEIENAIVGTEGDNNEKA